MYLYDNLKFFKKNIALVYADQKFTYENILDNSKTLSKNINENSLIFLLSDNDYESVISIISTFFSHSVIMLLNANIHQKSLDNLISLYKPDYILLNKNKKLKVEKFNNKSNFNNYFILETNKATKKYLNPKLFLLQSTSGSTGSPKNVRISYENLISNTNSIIKDLNIVENDVTITTLPMNYVYGLSIINTHLMSGSKIVLNKHSFFEKKFWREFLLNKVNNFGGVPFTYEILNKIGLKNENFKNIRYSTVAGGHLNDQTKKKIIEFYDKNNISFISMYGAAEATARMSILPSKFSKEKINSIGFPISGGEFKLLDEKNKIIDEPFVDGELIYNGKNVCMGYARNYNDLSKENENNFILNTGDIAYKDKDNFYYIKGKKSRYVKVIGNRISLDELEKILFEYGYENVCVQNVKEKITIFINKKFSEKDIKKYISNYTNLHESLFKCIQISEFPMTDNNKIDYNNDIFK